MHNFSLEAEVLFFFPGSKWSGLAPLRVFFKDNPQAHMQKDF